MNKDNKDYLQAFFKDHNYFQKDENVTPDVEKKEESNNLVSSGLVDLKSIFNKKEIEKDDFIKNLNSSIKTDKKTRKKQKTDLVANKKILNKLTPILSFITPTFVFEEKKCFKDKRNSIDYFSEIWEVHPNRIPDFTNEKELLIKKAPQIIKDKPHKKVVSLPKTSKENNTHAVFGIENKLNKEVIQNSKNKKTEIKKVVNYKGKLFKKNEIPKKIISVSNSVKVFLSKKTNNFRLLLADYLLKYKNYKKLKYKLYIEKQKSVLEERKREKIKKDILKKKLEVKKLISFSNKKSTVKKGFFTKKNLKETVQILGMVASVFVVGVVGLRLPALMSQYEFVWNADFFHEQQQSVEFLVDKKNVFSDIQSLPIAGVETEDSLFNKKNESLNITPPDTRIVIPKIAKNIPILTVGDESRIAENWVKLEADIQKALRDGVVHYPGTANPGEFGNAFITGHSSYYPWDDGRYKDVFAALHNLEKGDEYYIFHKGKKYKYVITEIKVVPPSDVSVLDQNYNHKESTLMTCTPVGTAKNRLILKAEQVEESY